MTSFAPHIRMVFLALLLALLTACGGEGGAGGGGETSGGAKTGDSSVNPPSNPPSTPPSVSGTAELSWMPPSSNTDGSSLADLAGYRVLYGRSPDDLSQTIDINNPSVNSYVVENLSSGTWYFAVVAVNRQGAASDLSNIASKAVS